MPDIIRTTSPLTQVVVKATGSAAAFTWNVPGTPLVRVLRSTEWYPETPNDFLSGTFLAQRVYEAHSKSFTDASIRHDEEYFYSLFSQKSDGAWCAPLRVHVFGAESPQATKRSVELYGQTERASARAELGNLAAIALPTFTMAGVIGMGVGTSLARGVFVAIGLASAAGWRILRPETDAWVLVKVLAVPAAVFALLIVSGGWMWLESTLLGASIGVAGGSLGRELLWMALALAAVAGAWALGRFAFVSSPRPDVLRAGLIVLVPAAFGLVLPGAAIITMAAVAAGLIAYEQGRKRPAAG